MTDICYIIGACKDYCENIKISPCKNDLVIAADGGFNILKEQNILPDILLGDFDSISNLPEHNCIIRHPVQKDDTDTFLAYKTAKEKGYSNFIIIGGFGGSFDHTVANLQTLLYIAKNDGRAFLVGDGCIITTIYNSTISFPKGYTGRIGIFSQGNTSKNVTIKGLKYEAFNITLRPDIPMGVSNEFKGERAEISVENGALMVVWYENFNNFIDKIDNFLIK